MTEHLTRDQLLHYLDGELPESAMNEAAEHFQACWTCRTDLERLEKDIALILDGQTEVFSPSLPPPPKAWPRIEPRLEASRGTVVESGMWRTMAPMLHSTGRLPFVLTAGALAAALIAALVWLPANPVSAAQALQKTEAADAKRMELSASQVIRQRVRIKKTTRRTRSESGAELESWRSGRSTYWNSATGSVPSELRERYKEYGISEDLPLSPSAISSWASLAGSEEVASRRDAEIVVECSSRPAEEARGLLEFSFLMQPDNWHLKGMTLSFDDAEFDIAEEDFAIMDRREVPPEVLASLESPDMKAQPNRSSGGIAKVSPAELSGPGANLNLDDIEMGVRYELHQIGADLGESIDISTRSPGEVVVNASGVSPERKDELTARLGSRTGVRLEFQPPADGPPSAKHPAQQTIVSSQEPTEEKPQDKRIEEFFGSAEAQEHYTRGVLETSTTALAHLYALHALADRWPADADARLSPAVKRELFEMVQDHAHALHSSVDVLKAETLPLLRRFGYEIPPNVPGISTLRWQDASVSGLDAAKSLDHSLRSLLTTTDNPASVDDALPKLQENLKELDFAVRQLLVSEM